MLLTNHALERTHIQLERGMTNINTRATKYVILLLKYVNRRVPIALEDAVEARRDLVVLPPRY